MAHGLMIDASFELFPARRLARAREIAAEYALLPQVEAVALGGSHATGAADADSDLDFYVYVRTEIPLSERRRIATAHASHAEVGNQFWEPGDEWVENDGQIRIDVMFRTLAWMEDQMARVLQRHEAAVGYSTCFWHNVLSSVVLFDRQGWFEELQQRARQPYPAALQRAIIAKNYPLLRRNQSSYLHQIERAVARKDLISVHHRLAAFLASYFDILFAVNRLPHPGEKRLLQMARESCVALPARMQERVQMIVAAAPGPELLVQINELIDNLDDCLRAHGLISVVS